MIRPLDVGEICERCPSVVTEIDPPTSTSGGENEASRHTSTLRRRHMSPSPLPG